MIETAKCKICNNKIDPDEYFTNSDESYYLCSEECADKIYDALLKVAKRIANNEN